MELIILGFLLFLIEATIITVVVSFLWAVILKGRREEKNQSRSDGGSP